MNKSLNQEVPASFTSIKCICYPFWSFQRPKWHMSLPFHTRPQLMKYLPFPFPQAWEKKTLSGGAPRIGHFKEYLSPGSLCFEFLFDWLSHFFLTSWHSLICPPYFPPSSRVFIIRMRVSNRFRGPGLALFEAGSLDFKVKWGRRFWATDVNRKWGCPKMKKKKAHFRLIRITQKRRCLSKLPIESTHETRIAKNNPQDDGIARKLGLGWRDWRTLLGTLYEYRLWAVHLQSVLVRQDWRERNGREGNWREAARSLLRLEPRFPICTLGTVCGRPP